MLGFCGCCVGSFMMINLELRKKNRVFEGEMIKRGVASRKVT